MNYIKENHLSLITIAFMVVLLLSGGSKLGSGFGAAANVTTITNPFVFTSTVRLGSSGTAVANQVITTCSPVADVSIVASTTGYAYCTGVTGVVSTDSVIAQFATTSVNSTMVADNFQIVGAKASTTAGVIDFVIANWTGKTAVPSAVGRAASTTSIRAGH